MRHAGPPHVVHASEVARGFAYLRALLRRCAFPFRKSMTDLYTRLREAGLDPGFVRNHILPDWWKDELGDVPANRQLAEIAISRMLGIPSAALRDRNARLELLPATTVRLKHVRNRDRASLGPSILIAERVATSVVRVIRGLPTFSGPMVASEVRRQLLEQHPVVTLGSLVDFAWDHGIVVIHLSALPPGRKLHGVAMFEGRVPVAVLAHGSDAPPRIAFDLAHELGHILLGHVTPDTPPLADEDLASPDEDPLERHANAFAAEVLTGEPEIPFEPVLGLDEAKLTRACRTAGAEHRIDPGVLALAYGFRAERMPVAQLALKRLGLATGARATVAAALSRRLPEELPETAARWRDLATRG